MQRYVTILCALAAVAGPVGADPIEDNFAARGSFATTVENNVGPGNAFTLYRPDDGNAGPYAVITWGNGTFANPSIYDGFLDHLASHGFVVIASNSGFVGSGAQMLEGVDWVIAENSNPDGSLFGLVNTGSIGATGHSQGGGGAINAGTDPRLTCTAPIQPVPGDVESLAGPMFVLAGENDTIVPPRGIATNTFLPATVPAIFGIRRGATHFGPLGDADGFRGYVTAWFAFCLQGKPAAAVAFVANCTLCANPDWVTFRKAGGPVREEQR